MYNTALSDKYSGGVIYLDHASTTPTDPEVLESMRPYFSSAYGNPSSLHSSGRRARQVIQSARGDIAEILGAEPDEIIFTGSGTESDNLAILGTARVNRSRGSHIIVSAIEHKAVLASAGRLKEDGFEVSYVPVDSYGKINIDECLSLVRPDTILISVMYANNEIGTVEPIAGLSRAIRALSGPQRVPLIHTDACQAAGALPLAVGELGVDLMSINGSKIYGPKGIGVLYKKRGVAIVPTVLGGDQEAGLRAGTESVPLVVGMSEALKRAEQNREKESKRISSLRDYLVAGLLERIPDAIINGHPTDRLPNNVHITIPNIEGESMLLMLDRAGIEVSTGSACSSADLRPSHVLLAIGQPAELAHGSIRFSLGRHTTRKELEYVLTVFPPIVDRLKRMSALTSTVINLHEKK